MKKKPNILIIWGDDIGWFNPSCYHQGAMGYRTPNIDRIAAEGARFTDWYGQQSCTAGRAAFITGQSPIRTGLTKVGLPGANLGLQPEDPTIAELLKPHGYVTGQFGKNHLGDRDEFLPTVHGFDEFFGNLYHLNAEEEPEREDYPKDPAFRKKFGPRGVLHAWANADGTQRIEDTGPLTRKRMETIDDELVAATLDFMQRAHDDDKPFFIWFNSTRMHVFTHLKRESVGATGLDVPTFSRFAALSGVAPRIGITSGYSFAGNAVLFGSCDITIATRDAHIGVGGPAMIEGGGLGVYSPKEVGPVEVHWNSGAIDVLAEDEAEATDLARRLLSFFQGRVAGGDAPDQRLLRHVVPENRLRVFDIRRAIDGLFDTGSFIELRGGWAKGMITGLARLDGRAVGVIANNCRYLSGAIDAEGADKAARFFQLCDAFGVPIVSLCDTPGFMVGPEAEKTAPIRRASRMFVVGAALSVPIFTVVVRKAYGLGAQGMAGGSLHAGPFTVAWPTGEFGGMGLEGAVRLGYRKELEAIEDAEAREARYQELVAHSYERGKAVSVAQFLEIDAVIDPADTRTWLLRGLASTPARRSGRYIDTW